MVTKIIQAVNRIRNNRIYAAVTAVLFPLCIVIYGLCKVNRGIDITDAAYSLGNFKYIDSLFPMWYYSTFFANLTGHMLMGLPGAGTLLGMNIYTGLIKVGTALIAYFFFTGKVRAAKEGVFAATLAALGLCWCPTPALYNYLTYFFFVLAVVLLYRGIISGKNAYLFAAGIVLGLNVFVRLPNLVQTVLIVALWLDAIYQHTKFKECLHKTLVCIYGFLAGLVPGIVLAGLTRGYGEYIKGISDLFGMTSEAKDYSAIDMVKSIIASYWYSLKYSVWLILFCVIGAIFFKVFPQKFKWLKGLACAAMGLAYILYLRKAQVVFLNFSSLSMAKDLTAVSLWIVDLVFAYMMFAPKTDRSDRILVTVSLVMLFVTPLGGNNNMYATMNCMFIAFPTIVKVFTDYNGGNEWLKGVKFTATIPIAFFVLFAFLHGKNYVFRDGVDAPMDTYVTNNPIVAHVKTTRENAERLETISKLFFDENLCDGTLLLYGELPGMSYYLNTEPAIETTWPSLRSYTAQKFEEKMNELDMAISLGNAKIPSVIISAVEYEQMQGDNLSVKQEILKDFLQKYNLCIRYNDNVMCVFTSN